MALQRLIFMFFLHVPGLYFRPVPLILKGSPLRRLCWEFEQQVSSFQTEDNAHGTMLFTFVPVAWTLRLSGGPHLGAGSTGSPPRIAGIDVLVTVEHGGRTAALIDVDSSKFQPRVSWRDDGGLLDGLWITEICIWKPCYC
ncbi:hypothetical protein PAAG_11438 [Paracoccidioides lutzii Pb01]|uniref:Uncharacterized protein n=1 Tax=Paracoccidioides lutzii (strain ATCC MYA-826 / Pb01) TaxID=502779 RepID=A0A0A2V688_PARBA|nr:hypothetical protein PAAG_11438 [Paracoccidioides lutzii Pb01]KGQ01862.1 hypothetical protein PAAG_11438 [Paracoccidioides lutzii Pb01]